MTAVYSVPVSKLLGIKLVNVMIVDCPSVRNFRNKTWLRGKLTFPFSNMIIGNSNAGLSAYGVSKKKSVCIYNGFNFDWILNVSNPDLIRQKLSITTRYVVGMVASFSIYKDYKTYYKAAELILKKRNDVTFLAVGDKTDSAESAALIKKEFFPFMRLAGRQSDVESYIAAMDVCVLSTFTEGISNSILEYMASAKPVVATDGGGTKEIVTESKTGFLVKAESPEALAERITQLLESENLVEKWVSQANSESEERARYDADYGIYAGYFRRHQLQKTHGRYWLNELLRRGSFDEEARASVLARGRILTLLAGCEGKLAALERLLREHSDDRCLIFTEHNAVVYAIARQHLIPALTHETKAAERKHILEAFAAGEYHAVVTSKVLNEGVDVPEAKVAIVLGGTSSAREYIQRLGRVLRKSGNL